MSIILDSFLQIIIALKNLFNAFMFWSDNNLICLILVSLLTLNISRFYDVKKKRWEYYLIKFFFVLYALGSLYSLYGQIIINSFDLWMSIIILPLLIFAIFAGSKIYPRLKNYIKYETFHILYSLISIIWLWIDSSSQIFGIWSVLISLIYSITLFLIVNLRYGKTN